MPNRREFCRSIAFTTAASAFPGDFAMADAAAPTAANALSKLTPTEQLMYATIRLSYQTTVQISGNTVPQTKWGTAFLFRFFETETSNVPVLVTNKHVVLDMKKCQLSFSSVDDDGMPNLENHIPISIDEFEKAWIPHPSVDLAIIPLANILKNLKAKPFLAWLNQSLIPTDEQLANLTPVEQVLTVGFPGAIWDDVHNLPIFHRGYTATPPYIPFKGEKEFLIDFTTWPGASGSPVLLFNDQGWIDRPGNTVLGGFRAMLLGVVY